LEEELNGIIASRHAIEKQREALRQGQTGSMPQHQL
jgi:hypothetical protein